MSYIGNPIVSTDFPVDYKSGNGSTTAFTLSIAPASVNSIDVQISGVSQSPQTYSVSGTTLTFSAAPPTGTNNIVVRHLGIAGIPNTPSAGSVVTTSIANNAVTPAKMANGGAELGYRNRIINGAMTIDQRNAGSAVTLNANNIYTVDRWRSGQLLQTWGSGVVTGQQSTDAPAGFVNSLKLTVATADSSLAATDGYGLVQQVEANNIGDLDWGKVTAKTVTISFWVRSSVVGTYSGSLVNNGSTSYSYVYTYSIPVADTWTYVTATVSGQIVNNTPTTGNGVGISVVFDLGSGSNLHATADTWTSGTKSRTSGSVNWISNAAATFYITGVQLEVGSSATGFEYRQYGQELALCQRYYWRNNDPTATSTFIPCGNGYTFNSTTGTFQLSFPVTMRTRVATINFSNVRVFGAANGSAGVVTSISGIQSTNTVFQADVAASSASFTAGTPAALQGNNNTAAYAEFSAEL